MTPRDAPSLSPVRLREARRAAGLTILQASRLLDVNPDIVSRWELGKTIPRGDRLIELARIYGVTVEALTQ